MNFIHWETEDFFLWEAEHFVIYETGHFSSGKRNILFLLEAYHYINWEELHLCSEKQAISPFGKLWETKNVILWEAYHYINWEEVHLCSGKQEISPFGSRTLYHLGNGTFYFLRKRHLTTNHRQCTNNAIGHGHFLWFWSRRRF